MYMMTIILVIIVQAKILVTDGKHNSAAHYANIMVVEIVKIATQWTSKLKFTYGSRNGNTIE